MDKTKSNQIPAMKCGHRILTDDIVKAEEYNNAFLQFATIDTSSASLPDKVYKTNSRLASINISQADTLEILKSLDTSKVSGPDGISCKMLKEIEYSIAPSFTRLLKLSFPLLQFLSVGNRLMLYLYLRKGMGLILEITDLFHSSIFAQKYVRTSFSNIYLISVEITTLSLCISQVSPLVTLQFTS